MKKIKLYTETRYRPQAELADVEQGHKMQTEAADLCVIENMASLSHTFTF